MKNRMICLVACVVFLLGASACSKVKQGDLYDVRLTMRTESGLFKDDVKIADANSCTTQEMDIPERKTIKVGSQSIAADLIAVEQFDQGGEQDVYLSPDETIKYRIDKKSNRFKINSQGDAVLAQNVDTLTEEAAIALTKAYLSDYLPDLNYDDYTYSCSSLVHRFMEDGTDSGSVPYFHIPADTSEQIGYYVLEYRKMVDGVRTTDSVVVVCDADGSITGVEYSDKDVDWTTAKFDQSLIEESVSEYLEEIISADRKFVSYNIEQQTLAYEDGKFVMGLTLTMQWLHNGTEYSSLCAVAVDIS